MEYTEKWIVLETDSTLKQQEKDKIDEQSWTNGVKI